MSEEDDATRRADAAAKRAAALFERQQQSDRRVADEEKRHSDMVAKTARGYEAFLAGPNVTLPVGPVSLGSLAWTRCRRFPRPGLKGPEGCKYPHAAMLLRILHR
jgi:hypothetical protein